LYPLISGKGRKHHGEILSEATKLVEAGKIKPITDPHHYRLETIEEAYEAMEKRIATGKVVISIE
jgi:NADPH:quinone reductase-like Zn-dependent oxidoreductase